MNDTTTTQAREGWKVYLKPRVLGMLFLGFSAGLPLLLVGGTFSAWLRDLGIELAAIGFLSWVGMAHSIKVLWAPLIDRAPVPLLSRLLGRRRAWMLLAQLVIAAALLGMALTDPREHLGLVALWAVLAAFGSATQDVAIDAYRVEAEARHRQAAMAATYVTGYRVAILAAGAGALHLASIDSWTLAYSAMALLMGVGIVTTLIIAEPTVTVTSSTLHFEQRVADYLAQTSHAGWRRNLTAWFIGAMVCPFAEFFQRYGKASLLILAFIATFRISDIFMGVMANPFYLDLGFSKAQIANIAAAFGLGMTLLGAGLGGLLVARFGIAPILLLTAFMAPITNLAFAWLAFIGPETYGLVLAIVADNITGGLAISVFIAYLSSLTNTAYTATQYALFSSLMTLPGQFAAGFTGVLAANVGWVSFFMTTALTGLPAIILAAMLLKFAHPDRMQRPGVD
ncbi:AmpG family muropeptide MFS transporter [Halopseudomonas bauzanensis]|uniref:AmpG family muropeptide MFS transporter n=1 Tax=Halopseudomonas bauzanensis TaxID=653930 RepID=A0A1H9PPV3_9GAMM|nr:MFS transporter [Halopseudomonas bauzanensis]TKA93578.1 AmpG family muropeptide MFS transporter [Halopseudomonas bauzanensis]SER50356.1 MFS transporter, PAT family, beta-lactamase induction signal transducer AmpG [Halopseudomonas bauzanensis]SFL71762.1 MFS transporter, PAT family, beta-lactamase induction signal transducer AmpG [Halopseudomonas bauzanensis]